MLADRAVDSVERLLLSIPAHNLGFAASEGASADEAARREIEAGTHQLETLLNASIDKNLDLFELYTMRNILTVRPEDRPHMRLAHYHGLDLDDEPRGDGATAESVTALRRRLQASQRLHAALEAERARNGELLRRLGALMGVRDAGVKRDEGETGEDEASPFGFLADKGDLEGGGSDQPVTTTTEFALSQLQALRALSASLRTLLPDGGGGEASGSGQGTASVGGRTWRRERAEYIEASSRKYLERAVGLELGGGGEVRDGEWQGSGRAPGRDEVEGLEGVAAALGGVVVAQGKGGAREGGAMADGVSDGV